MTEIRDGGLDLPQVQALLAAHLTSMRANSPACSVHALDLSGLRAPGIDFWTAWQGDLLMGCGALKTIDATQGEIKSMRTAPEYLRSGVGAAIVGHIIGAARARGMKRLSLETGTGVRRGGIALSPVRLYRLRGVRRLPRRRSVQPLHVARALG